MSHTLPRASSDSERAQTDAPGGQPPGLDLPDELVAEIDALVSHYPQPRSASLMVLHALQDHFGWLPQAAIEWTAARLSLRPINVYELVTFYPMFRQQPAGKYQIKICRTLSCALGGADALHRHYCERLNLDPTLHGVQTTADGRFSVEFVECLASCGTAPVMMLGDEFHEGVTLEKADEILRDCESTEAAAVGSPKTARRRAAVPKKTKQPKAK